MHPRLTPGPAVGRAGPGLLVAFAGGAVALGLHAVAGDVPAALAAVALGALVANAGHLPRRTAPGLSIAAGPVLKAGVVLLGLELALQEALGLGLRGLAVVVVVVVATYAGTLWAGRLLGVAPGLTLLVATGFAICGVSAIAAVREVADADEEEVAYAVALVTLCGSLAIVVLPPLGALLGLDEREYGAWVGASVHDVAQVVASASVVGGAAVGTAIVVKLTRVLLLGPLVAWIAASRRSGTPGGLGRRAVPAFVLLFAGATALRTLDVLPQTVLAVAADLKTTLFAVALFAVGTRVRVRRLVAVGPRPLALGLGSWAIVAAVAYAGVRLVGV